MSADNLIRIKKKDNGLYQVRHESASSLIHELEGVVPSEDDLLLSIVADDIDGHDDAVKKAHDFLEEIEKDGGIVEYGVVDEGWRK